MPLQPIRSRSLSDQVFEQLVSEILAGRYAPGSVLPAERALSEAFDVNRHVVREALKRMEQLGLVKVSQGGGTKVLDFTRHAGLDLLALMAEGARGGADVFRYWLAVLEMRAAIGADLSRLCALRASAEVRADLLAISEQMQSAAEEQLFALEVRFWDRMLDGADNIAYRLACNSMRKGTYAVPDMAKKWSAAECKQSGYRAAIAQAIAAGEADSAETRTRSDMRTAVEAFARLLPESSERKVEPSTREQRRKKGS